METSPRQFRLTAERLARLDELGRIWGPVKPLTRTDVLNVLIDRAHDAEAKKARGRKDR